MAWINSWAENWARLVPRSVLAHWQYIGLESVTDLAYVYTSAAEVIQDFSEICPSNPSGIRASIQAWELAKSQAARPTQCPRWGCLGTEARALSSCCEQPSLLGFQSASTMA